MAVDAAEILSGGVPLDIVAVGEGQNVCLGR